VGHTVEISYTISGYSAGSFNFGFGSGQAGVTRTADGTYIERGTLTTDTNLYAYSTNLTGVVTINYVRRVLESGQTNPGEGTIIQWVSLPWDYSVLTPGTVPIVSPAAGGYLYFQPTGSPITNRLFLYDGVTVCRIEPANLQAGRYALVQQFSAALGRMRVGLYNPATGTLTWSSATLAGGSAYRGFFPIYGTGTQQRLRFFFGGGNFPIHVGGLRWLNSIGSDAECVRLSKEMLP
jgi:hypothetical protein